MNTKRQEALNDTWVLYKEILKAISKNYIDNGNFEDDELDDLKKIIGLCNAIEFGTEQEEEKEDEEV